jgi:hypothetical protein
MSAPVVAWCARPSIYFLATFDMPAAPGNPLPQAEIGQFTQVTPPGGFEVVASPTEGGELRVSDQGTVTEVVLRGLLKKKFVGQDLRFECRVRPVQSTTGLQLRLLDDSDSGMIDATFGGDGWIRIGGKQVAPYESGATYNVAIDLTDPIAGPEFWAVSITKHDGSIWLDSGPLTLTKQLTVRSIEIVRPAASAAGEFRVDDMQVLSYTLAFGL